MCESASSLQWRQEECGSFVSQKEEFEVKDGLVGRMARINLDSCVDEEKFPDVYSYDDGVVLHLHKVEQQLFSQPVSFEGKSEVEGVFVVQESRNFASSRLVKA